MPDLAAQHLDTIRAALEASPRECPVHGTAPPPAGRARSGCQWCEQAFRVREARVALASLIRADGEPLVDLPDAAPLVATSRLFQEPAR